MTYEQWRAERACEGKLRFPDEREARVNARDSAVAYQEPYEAWTSYECPNCLGWHIGHRPGWVAVSVQGRKKEETA